MLIDGDLALRNLDLFIGLEQRIQFSALDAARGLVPFEQIFVTDERWKGLSFVQLTRMKQKFTLDRDELQTILERVAEQGFDYILYDCPAGIDTGFLLPASFATDAILVSLLEVPAIRDVDRVAGILEGFKNIKTVNLLINRVDSESVKRKDSISVLDMLNLVGIPLLAMIPDDPKVITSANIGVPIIQNVGTPNESPASLAFDNAALRFIDPENPLIDFNSKLIPSKQKTSKGFWKPSFKPLRSWIAVFTFSLLISSMPSTSSAFPRFGLTTIVSVFNRKTIDNGGRSQVVRQGTVTPPCGSSNLLAHLFGRSGAVYSEESESDVIESRVNPIVKGLSSITKVFEDQKENIIDSFHEGQLKSNRRVASKHESDFLANLSGSKYVHEEYGSNAIERTYLHVYEDTSTKGIIFTHSFSKTRKARVYVPFDNQPVLDKNKQDGDKFTIWTSKRGKRSHVGINRSHERIWETNKSVFKRRVKSGVFSLYRKRSLLKEVSIRYSPHYPCIILNLIFQETYHKIRTDNIRIKHAGFNIFINLTVKNGEPYLESIHVFNERTKESELRPDFKKYGIFRNTVNRASSTVSNIVSDISSVHCETPHLRGPKSNIYQEKDSIFKPRFQDVEIEVRNLRKPGNLDLENLIKMEYRSLSSPPGFVLDFPVPIKIDRDALQFNMAIAPVEDGTLKDEFTANTVSFKKEVADKSNSLISQVIQWSRNITNKVAHKIGQPIRQWKEDRLEKKRMKEMKAKIPKRVIVGKPPGSIESSSPRRYRK